MPGFASPTTLGPAAPGPALARHHTRNERIWYLWATDSQAGGRTPRASVVRATATASSTDHESFRVLRRPGMIRVVIQTGIGVGRFYAQNVVVRLGHVAGINSSSVLPRDVQVGAIGAEAGAPTNLGTLEFHGRLDS